ncbi:uncharacterized protein LOC127131816 [Lathyrus oleraceus]|uniref:uncharacterized protein LOC127131816 n=1 Tax=Pisum sativum TaxID=3888 RepID=UPI0021D0E352|nr:uncharacterized protein LOC127131816 [Pisum sativum]
MHLPEVLALLQHQGFINFLECNSKYSEDLVRVFYAGLHDNFHGHKFHSRIGPTKVPLKSNIWNQYFDMSVDDDGNPLPEVTATHHVAGYEFKNALNDMLRRPYTDQFVNSDAFPRTVTADDDSDESEDQEDEEENEEEEVRHDVDYNGGDDDPPPVDTQDYSDSAWAQQSHSNEEDAPRWGGWEFEGDSDDEEDFEGESDSDPESGGNHASKGRPTSKGSPTSEEDSEQVQRLQKIRQIPRRFVEFSMLQDTEINSKGEATQCAM